MVVLLAGSGTRPTGKGGAVGVDLEAELVVLQPQDVAALLTAVGDKDPFVPGMVIPVDGDGEHTSGDETARPVTLERRHAGHDLHGVVVGGGERRRHHPRQAGPFVEGEHLVLPSGVFPRIDEFGDSFGLLISNVVELVDVGTGVEQLPAVLG